MEGCQSCNKNPEAILFIKLNFSFPTIFFSMKRGRLTGRLPVIILALLQPYQVWSQTTLTFTGKNNMGSHVPMHHVVVENLTQDWSDTLYYPDTLQVLSGVGIDDHETVVPFFLSPAMPNPSNGTASFHLSISYDDHVVIDMLDLLGRSVKGLDLELQAGMHTFRLWLLYPQVYFFSVRTSRHQATEVIMNMGSSGVERIEYMGGETSDMVLAKSSRLVSNNLFSPGDEMRYRGYVATGVGYFASNVVQENLYGDGTVELEFLMYDTTANYTACPDEPVVVDYDGNQYFTVQIGSQCWMKQNLRTTHYADGTAIPTSSEESYTNPYYYDYASSSLSLQERGYLYNWPAAMHGDTSSNTVPSGVQGVCPYGWHLPSHGEWAQLADYVGSQSEYVCGGNSTYIAKALAVPTGWTSSSNYACAVGNNQSVNNATGFSAYPAGHCRGDNFQYTGQYTYFWSSTQYNETQAWCRQLCYNYQNVNYFYNARYCGFSVRCLRNG